LELLGVFTLVLAAGEPALGNGALNPDWEPLLENDLRAAVRNLGVSEEELRELQNHDWGVATNGLARARGAIGDYAGAADAWIRLSEWSFDAPGRTSELRSPEFLEGYLSCLGRCMGKVSIDERLLPLLRRLAAESEEPDKAFLARDLLLELQRRAGDVDGMARTAADLGLITRWEAVAGPFGGSGALDLEDSFPPEPAPNLRSYEGYYGPVTWHEISASLPDGYVDLGSLVYPARGVAYARTALEASDPGAGLLTLETTNSARVWWNGRLVVSRDRTNLDLERKITVPVEILTGVNRLVVKSLDGGGGWGHRVFVRPMDFASRITLEPVASTEFPPCLPIDETDVSDRVRPGIEDMAGAGAPEEMGETGILACLYAAELAWSGGRYSDADGFLEKVMVKRPDWSLGRMLLGEISADAGAERPESRSRLENEARNHFRAALEASPDVIPAAVGLGEYYRSRKTFDSALEVLEEARKTVESDFVHPDEGSPLIAEDALPGLEYELGRVFEDLEFEIEARRAYELARTSGSGDPDVWVRLSSLERDNRAGVRSLEIAREGNRLFPTNTAMLTELERAARSAGAEDRLFPAYETRLSMYPCEISTRESLAGILERAGRADEAFQQYGAIEELTPGRPLPYIRRGDYLLRATDALSPAEEPRLKEALDSLEAGKERKPQDLSLARRVYAARKAIEYVRDATTVIPFPALRDEEYDVDYFRMDKGALEDLPQERAGAVYLLDLMVVSVFPNGTHTSLIHQSVLLKDKEGRDRFSEISVPQDAEIVFARTIAPNGTVYNAEAVTDTGNEQSISMYGLEDGAVVDYAYRMKRASIPSPGRDYEELTYYFGEVENPMLLSRLVLLVSEGVKVEWRAHPLDFAPEIRDATGFRIWTWEKRLSPGVKEESSMPSTERLVPTVKITTCPDWTVGVKRAESLLLGRREAESTVAEVADLLALDAKRPRAKVERVYKYIQDVIEPGGVGGATVLDTLKNRAGSPFDKTMLAQALLADMGVPSRVAFGYDAENGERFPPLPSASYLGGELLVVPGHGDGDGAFDHPEDLWMSFESRYAPLGEIPAAYREQIRFLVAPHGVVIQPPLSDPLPGGWVERHLEFEIDPEGASECRGDFSYHGDLRSGIRRAVADQTVRERLVSSELSRHVRGIKVEESEFRGIDQLEDNVSIIFRGTVDRFLQPRGDDWTLDPVAEKSDLSSAAPEPSREKPVEFDNPVKYNPYQAGFRIAGAGEGGAPAWFFSGIPRDTVLVSRFGYYCLDFEIEGDTLWVTRSAYVPAQWIDPEDYPEFLEFCRAADAAEAAPVIVSGLD